jgi:hypothetical protein
MPYLQHSLNHNAVTADSLFFISGDEKDKKSARGKDKGEEGERERGSLSMTSFCISDAVYADDNGDDISLLLSHI